MKKMFFLFIVLFLPQIIDYAQQLSTNVYQDKYIYAYIKPYERREHGNMLSFDYVAINNKSNQWVEVSILHRDLLLDISDVIYRNEIRDDTISIAPGRTYMVPNYLGKNNMSITGAHYKTVEFQIMKVKPEENTQSITQPNATIPPQTQTQPQRQSQPQSQRQYKILPQTQTQPQSRPQPEPMMFPSDIMSFHGYVLINNKKTTLTFNLDFNSKTGTSVYQTGSLPLTISNIEYTQGDITFTLTEKNPQRTTIPNNKLGGNTTAIYKCQYLSDGTLKGIVKNSKGDVYNMELKEKVTIWN